MLLTDARRPARSRPDGTLVPLADQDRGLWDHDAIAEGVALVTAALPVGPVGPYQVQAAIAAVHDEAARAEDTDWPQVLALYGVLEQVDPSPMVTLNRAVALAMVEGPEAGLGVVATLEDDPRMATASSSSGPASASWPATSPAPAPTTTPPPAGPPASPSSATSPPRPPASPRRGDPSALPP
jgi:predicted RNA polymerase sigma factor